MSKVSIIIPSRNEKYLTKTVEDVFSKATGEIEVIVILDGLTDYPIPKYRDNLHFIVNPKPKGLRPAIKDGASMATGKYLMKLDSHCMVSEGFDEVLQKDCEDNWVVVPRYYALDPENWCFVKRDIRRKRFHDYFYLGCPWVRSGLHYFQDIPWESRDKRRGEIKLDETMTIQASLWFMKTEHYYQRLCGLDETRWGTWSCEQQEISLKTWLGGGKVMVNKDVWNAHYQRPIEERRKLVPEFSRRIDSYIHRDFCRYFMNNKWEGQIHKFDWLIEHFWPLPTPDTKIDGERHTWPEDWKDYYVKNFNL